MFLKNTLLASGMSVVLSFPVFAVSSSTVWNAQKDLSDFKRNNTFCHGPARAHCPLDLLSTYACVWPCAICKKMHLHFFPA